MSSRQRLAVAVWFGLDAIVVRTNREVFGVSTGVDVLLAEPQSLTGGGIPLKRPALFVDIDRL